MKNILIINTHPDKASFSSALAQSYHEGAKSSGANAELIHLSDLKFDPILHQGYKVIQELEPDLMLMQQKIKDASHIVFVTPVWWGSVPALFKGFLDRTFLPGYAFKYRKNSSLWDKLLKGRTARIIVTSDGPVWWNLWMYKDPTINMLKKSVLEFCGFKVKVTKLGSVKTLKKEELARALSKVRKLGSSG